MDIRAAEISAILKKQIKDFGKEAQVSEIGQVLSVGDGIVNALRERPCMLHRFPDGVSGAGGPGVSVLLPLHLARHFERGL